MFREAASYAMAAMAVVSIALPGTAMASGPGELSGTYLVTLKATRPASYSGQTACIALNNDGSAGFAHSGTWAYNGAAAGYFFVVGSVLTAYTTGTASSYLTFSGVLHAKQLTFAAVTEVVNGVPALEGNYTVLRTICQNQ